jgi:hypothetical protein
MIGQQRCSQRGVGGQIRHLRFISKERRKRRVCGRKEGGLRMQACCRMDDGSFPNAHGVLPNLFFLSPM